jgi:hypothetical protein
MKTANSELGSNPYRCFTVVQYDASGKPLLRQRAHLRDDELVELC